MKMKSHNTSKGEEIEGVKRVLQVSKEESESVSKLIVPPHRPLIDRSFYDDFALQGIRVDRVEPGLIVCSFRVPPRLTDRGGNLSAGAIANLIDVIGAGIAYMENTSLNVSANISISYISTAKVDDELEVTAELLGRKGLISGTVVTLRNKATGETIAQGRHTLSRRPASKM